MFQLSFDGSPVGTSKRTDILVQLNISLACTALIFSDVLTSYLQLSLKLLWNTYKHCTI